MDFSEDELFDEDVGPADNDALKEAWPIPPEDYTREFEEYLMDIGLRL